MLKNISIFFLLMCTCGDCFHVKIGSAHSSTKGEVWPRPQKETKYTYYYIYMPTHFRFRIISNTCDLLRNAITRYSMMLTKMFDTTVQNRKLLSKKKQTNQNNTHKNDPYFVGTIKELEVILSDKCDEQYPYMGMFEGYGLEIVHRSNKSDIMALKSPSVWGILRGLETFYQLFYVSSDYNEIRIESTSIIDYPEYSHRGLLLDTSRHFISVDKILTTLEAMAMNKMNVFHWHIVDDQSFPYQSQAFPDLSSSGAYHELNTYSPKDIKQIVQYARERGIRVIPEIPVPGRTHSWGASYPELLTECYKNYEIHELGPLNPTRRNTYKFLYELLNEVVGLFPDKYFHIGGDKVNIDCWNSNPEITSYMDRHSMLSIKELYTEFMEKVIRMIPNKTTIAWQDALDNGIIFPSNNILQVWKSKSYDKLKQILQYGYKIIYSSSWQLDEAIANSGDWERLYNADPRAILGNTGLGKSIIGGEACMWTELVNDNNLIPRTWPRASAVAERLWTSKKRAPTVKFNCLAKRRIQEQTCRMIRRGIDAQPPNGHSYCLL